MIGVIQMLRALQSVLSLLFFNLISIALILSVVLYRTDFTFAQADESVSDSSVALPRDSDQADDDVDDDDLGDGDGEDDELAVHTYTVKPGDTLRRIAANLGIPYPVLRDQTDTPSLIYVGQVFYYSIKTVDAEAAAPSDAGSANPPAPVTLPSPEGETGLPKWEFTVRQGDTLSHIAIWLGVPIEELAQQVDDPRRIVPGQKFLYHRENRIDTPPLVTDNDGTDSDGIDTTGLSTDNDGTDSDGWDTENNQPYTDNDGIDTEYVQPQNNQQQVLQQQVPYTDNDGTDSDGIATSQLTDNDGTDSDGIATSQLTDNDGTDSDGIITTVPSPDTPPSSPDTPPDSDSGIST